MAVVVVVHFSGWRLLVICYGCLANWKSEVELVKLDYYSWRVQTESMNELTGAFHRGPPFNHQCPSINPLLLRPEGDNEHEQL